MSERRDPLLRSRLTSGVERRRVVVSGRVQGVWFRESTRRFADGLDVAGWVRNRGDGSVEAVFEGQRDLVERCVEWCRKGPTHAEVTSIEVVAEHARGELGFVVR